MSIRNGIEQALVRIENTQGKAGRPDPVKLELAVKARTPEEYYEAIHVLAESDRPILLGHDRVQEARDAITAIQQVEGTELHLIGPLRPNKINHTLGCVDAIESVDCPVLVKKINTRADQGVPIFLEANVPGEETKHGRYLSEVGVLVDAALGAKHLRLCGFMTVGLNSPIEKDVHTTYAQLCSICERTGAMAGLHGLEPSMGMSADLGWVIAKRASIARIGITVFGERRPRD